MTRFCKYNCGVELGAFDEENRKYLEAGTGGLHTKERCQEAKARLAQKNDHGNETFQDIKQDALGTPKDNFVDHTAKGQPKLKSFSASTTEQLDDMVNGFLTIVGDRFRGGQFHTTDKGFAAGLWYEETK